MERVDWFGGGAEKERDSAAVIGKLVEFGDDRRVERGGIEEENRAVFFEGFGGEFKKVLLSVLRRIRGKIKLEWSATHFAKFVGGERLREEERFFFGWRGRDD